MIDLSRLKGNVPDSVFSLLPAALEKYEVNTSFRVPHFLGQISHESGNFTIKTESLYYKTAERIVAIWPSRFNLTGTGGKKNANDYVRNEEKLAGAVYDGRMGNNNPGDGFRFRGGGFLQLTGKDAYKGYAEHINKTLEETADLIRSNNVYSLDCSLWEYVTVMKLNTVADQGMGDDIIKKITKKINGGYNGLEDRISKVRKFDELT
jgi:putative chitinase